MKRALLCCGLVALGSLCADVAVAVNSLATSNNGVGGGIRVGIAIDAVSSGRACGMIGGVVVGQAPAGACPPGNVNGPIPPPRIVNVTDAAGNHVDAESDKVGVLFGLKTYLVNADSTAVTLGTFAQAEFVDPMSFTSLTNDAFDIDLVRSFFEANGTPGILIGGGHGGADGSASPSFHADMSSNLTGPLLAMDLAFALGQPLGIHLTLGTYLAGLPSWNEAALTAQLRTLFDADTADDMFSLANFAFPAIPIHVAAGQTLIVDTDDIRTAVATVVPEPAIVWLLGGGLAALLTVARRQRSRQ